MPVYLGALGPQMLRVAGQVSDGVLPNWSSPEEIARMREHVAADIPIAHYIRVCIDEDEDAARRAFASNMLGYALARPGQRKDQGYRAHFARMGFDEVLTDLEARREAGAPESELVDRMPADLLLRVGYFGNAAGAAKALQRLSQGHDEAMVRLIAPRPGDLSSLPGSRQSLQTRRLGTLAFLLGTPPHPNPLPLGGEGAKHAASPLEGRERAASPLEGRGRRAPRVG